MHPVKCKCILKTKSFHEQLLTRLIMLNVCNIIYCIFAIAFTPL